MDIKLGGIELSVLTEALLQAKEGRIHILSLRQIRIFHKSLILLLN
jgi:polyribonucleotide nucleotidyltransferase